MIHISQLEIWATIAQSAINFIVIYIITGLNQKATVTDNKTDLRTTKEDLMTELKDSREVLIKEIEIATNSAIDLITTTIKGHEGMQDN
jgi:hypothetical protein